MLELEIAPEFFDSEKQMFFYPKVQTVKLEHSLISISKWESRWEKPYLPSRTVPGISGAVENIDYISCMIIGSVESYIPLHIYENYMKEIQTYIQAPHTATKIYRVGSENRKPETITAEIIYYWMIKFNIPMECEKWHFNRLLTLIDVCNVKEATLNKKNKMSPQASAAYRHELNKARKGLSQ